VGLSSQRRASQRGLKTALTSDDAGGNIIGLAVICMVVCYSETSGNEATEL
jgi:hypothetical protein